jgi:DNA repair exonuclease SbcCD ATPase subunit
VIVIKEDAKLPPMYTISDQEVLYLKSEIYNLNKTIRTLKSSYLYAENEYHKDQLRKVREELTLACRSIDENETVERELIKDRNLFKEGKEKLESQVRALHDALHGKEELLQQHQVTKNDLQQELLSIELEKKQLTQKISEIKKNQQDLFNKNQSLVEENILHLRKIDSLNSELQSKKLHISDLNSALALSEDTKKELFYNLMTKTEELEKVMSERKHALDSLQFAKNQLIEAEKQKMEYIKTFISQYQKHFEENEWWLSSQFADIDQRTKLQDERIEAVEQEQEIHFTIQNDVLEGKFKQVEQRFLDFLTEVDSIREYNSTLTHSLLELKRMVESQKRSQNHIITARQKSSAEKLPAPKDHYFIKDENK